jgi:ABC-2 type transport system ATP-binding protein
MHRGFEKSAECDEISCSKITKSYSGIKALDNINCAFKKNEIHGLIGGNGAGKSTLIKILTGVISTYEGEIKSIVGKFVNKFEGVTFGACFQNNQYFKDLTCLENALFFGSEASAKSLLSRLGIPFNKYPETLSGGTLRKLSLVMALVGNSNYLILDEPAAGVDNASRGIIYDILSEYRQNRIIIIVTHYISEAEMFCDRFTLLDASKLIATGTYSEIIDLKNLKARFIKNGVCELKAFSPANIDESEGIILTPTLEDAFLNNLIFSESITSPKHTNTVAIFFYHKMKELFTLKIALLCLLGIGISIMAILSIVGFDMYNASNPEILLKPEIYPDSVILYNNLKPIGNNLIKSSNVTKDLYDYKLKDLRFAEKTNIYAFQLPDSAYVSESCTYAIPIVVDTYCNTLLNGTATITTSWWPDTADQVVFDPDYSHLLIILISIYPLGFLIIAIGLAMQTHSETLSGFKHLQFIAGVSPICYWGIICLRDIIFLFYAVAIVSTFNIWLLPELTEALLISSLIYTFQLVFITHLIMRFSSSLSAGFITSLMILWVFSVIIQFILYTFDLVENLSQFALSLSIIPGFTSAIYFVPTLINKHNWQIGDQQWKDTICANNYTSCCLNSPCEISPIYLYHIMAASGILFFFLIIVTDSRLKFQFAEENISCNLSVSNRIKKVEAVLPNSIIWLKGKNGEGKSTFLEVLANKISYRGTLLNYRTPIGYCPQYDALNLNFTGEQTLILFSKFVGRSSELAKQLIYYLNLTNIKDRLIAEYSGGNKRKINLAIAIICSEKLMLLDEPFTGVDSGGCQTIWSIIKAFHDPDIFYSRQPLKKTVVFTSHRRHEENSQHVMDLTWGQEIASTTQWYNIKIHKKAPIRDLIPIMSCAEFKEYLAPLDYEVKPLFETNFVTTSMETQ